MIDLSTVDAIESGGLKIPRDKYGITCIDAEHRIAGTGTSMITLRWEVKRPEKVTLADGKVVNVAGLQVRQPFFLTPKAIGRLVAFRKLMGLPALEAQFDELNPSVQEYKGLGAEAILRGTQTTQKDDSGQDILVDDQPILKYTTELDMILKADPTLKVVIPF
jgi:hypothetical protein